MTTESLVKDIGEIHARLFDHRPVLQGEVSYFLREFEDKRNDREAARLQKTLEYGREMSQILIPKCTESMDEHLPALKAKLSTAIEMCNMILERENEEGKENWLKEQKAERVKNWTKFMDEMCEKSAAVDREHDEDNKRLKEYYIDLEEKLKITPHSSPIKKKQAPGDPRTDETP